jgi:hypothetical protein
MEWQKAEVVKGDCQAKQTEEDQSGKSAGNPVWMPAGFQPVLNTVISGNTSKKKGEKIMKGNLNSEDPSCKSNEGNKGQGYMDTCLDIPPKNQPDQVHSTKVAKVLISPLFG